MKNKIYPIRNLFIKRMIYSSAIQVLVLAILILLARDYMNHYQLNSAYDDLLVKDQYTLDEIGSYQILENKYALELELHNISDIRKWDSVKFLSSLKDENMLHNCHILNNKLFKLCEVAEHEYLGVSNVMVDQKTIGYILSRKKYDPLFQKSLQYDVILIGLTIIATFIFNFIFLFLSLKNKFEYNTRSLLDFISHEDTGNQLIKIDIDEYKTIAEKFLAEKIEISKLQNEKTYFKTSRDIAAQVAHDIRSPLAVMQMMLAAFPQSFPKDTENILKSAIKSVHDIADNLLIRYRKNENESIIPAKVSENSDGIAFCKPIFNALIEEIISQKSLEWKENPCEIRFDATPISKFLAIKSSAISLKTVLSNLLNNAYEALENNRFIFLKLFVVDNFLKLVIADSGRGIPIDKISDILSGVSLKHSGRGLGLSNAKDFIENLGGTLNLNSTLGKGTEVTLSIPKFFNPPWLSTAIKIPLNATIIIIDNDLCVHDFWRARLKNCKQKTFYFLNGESFFEWNQQQVYALINCIFLIDYELGNSSLNGLAISKQLNLKENGYLITSHAGDINIQQKVTEVGISLVPKSILGDIEILFTIRE